MMPSKSDFIPPILMRWLRPPKSTVPHVIFGDYPDWQAALSDAAPYETDLNLYSRVTEQIRSERRYSATPAGTEFTPILCGILLGGGKVLDYGGGLGFIYFEALKVVPTRIEWWRVVELPPVVEHGNSRFADGKLQFFDSIDKALVGQRPDTIICSHILQYLHEPYSTMRSLIGISPEILVLNELPIAEKERIALQKLHPSWGGGTRPFQIISEAKLREATAGYEIEIEIELRAWASFEGVRHVGRIYKRAAVES